MTGMVHAAVASDATEAEEIQDILRDAGIESVLEPDAESDSLVVLVPEAQLEAAQEAIESGTEPDTLVPEP
jgi:putative signal transducing protein